MSVGKTTADSTTKLLLDLIGSRGISVADLIIANEYAPALFLIGGAIRFRRATMETMVNDDPAVIKSIHCLDTLMKLNECLKGTCNLGDPKSGKATFINTTTKIGDDAYDRYVAKNVSPVGGFYPPEGSAEAATSPYSRKSAAVVKLAFPAFRELGTNARFVSRDGDNLTFTKIKQDKSGRCTDEGNVVVNQHSADRTYVLVLIMNLGIAAELICRVMDGRIPPATVPSWKLSHYLSSKPTDPKYTPQAPRAYLKLKLGKEEDGPNNQKILRPTSGVVLDRAKPIMSNGKIVNYGPAMVNGELINPYNIHNIMFVDLNAAIIFSVCLSNLSLSIIPEVRQIITKISTGGSARIDEDLGDVIGMMDITDAETAAAQNFTLGCDSSASVVGEQSHTGAYPSVPQLSSLSVAQNIPAVSQFPSVPQLSSVPPVGQTNVPYGQAAPLQAAPLQAAPYGQQMTPPAPVFNAAALMNTNAGV